MLSNKHNNKVWKDMAVAGFLPLCLFTFLLLPASCSDDDFLYQDTPRVRLVGDSNWTLGTDSLTVSFLTISGDETAIDVDARIMGNVADHDRTAAITVDQSLTTAPASLYSVPTTVTIPAGQSKATFQVTLRKSELLQSQTVRLYIKVTATDDFQPGVNEDNHLLLKWNDILSKPLFWDDISQYFGDYSNTKYRFMLQTLAAQGYDTGALDPNSGTNWSDYHNFSIVLANALDDYNASHATPLTDENGALVTF